MQPVPTEQDGYGSAVNRVILIHGFNVADGGERTTGRLARFFEERECQVKLFRYGWRGILGVRFGNPALSRLLADMSDTGDIVVAHSNGCAIAHVAAHRGAAFGAMVYINPALDRDAPLAAQIPALHVWHSPSDRPVAIAKWLPWHTWGDMGAVGYRGPRDLRITNFNKERGFPVSSRAHSDVFEEAQLSYFGPLIASHILADASTQPLTTTT